MNIKTVQDFNESDLTISDLTKMSLLGAEYFSIKRIALYPQKKLSKKILEEGIKKGEKFHIKVANDEVFLNAEVLLYEASRFIRKYMLALKEIQDSKSIPFEVKLYKLKEYALHFEALSNFHNYNSRFLYATSDIFDIVVDNKGYSISIEHIAFLEDIKSTISEFFSIRKELFDELRLKTLNHLNIFDLNVLENSTFKILNENGHYLISEFVLGLIHTNMIDPRTENIDLLHFKLRELFGITYKEKRTGYYHGKVLDRNEPAKLLQKMVDAIEAHKRRKKNSKKGKMNT